MYLILWNIRSAKWSQKHLGLGNKVALKSVQLCGLATDYDSVKLTHGREIRFLQFVYTVTCTCEKSCEYVRAMHPIASVYQVQHTTAFSCISFWLRAYWLCDVNMGNSIFDKRMDFSYHRQSNLVRIVFLRWRVQRRKPPIYAQGCVKIVSSWGLLLRFLNCTYLFTLFIR